jgi:hypothetical protein
VWRDAHGHLASIASEPGSAEQVNCLSRAVKVLARKPMKTMTLTPASLLMLSLRSVLLLSLSMWAMACAGAPGHAHAVSCDLIAAPTGHDDDAGSLTAPLRSPQAVIDRLRPGQTGCLRGGTYNARDRHGFIAYFGHGGRKGRRLTLRGYPGERVTLRGVVAVTRRASRVRISDLSIDDPVPYAASGQLTVQLNAAHTLLERLDITNHASKTCIILGAAGAGRATHTIIRNTVLHDCGVPGNVHDQAIYVQEAANTTIERNVIERTGTYAIQLYPNAQDSLIRRNILADNGGGVIVAGEGRKSSSHSLIENNVISHSLRQPNLEVYWGTRVGRDNVARGNCLWDGAMPDDLPGLARRGNLTANPMLTATGALPYRVSSGSHCHSVVGSDVGISPSALAALRRRR